MDPNENYAEQLRLSKHILEGEHASLADVVHDADRLAQLAVELNEWIANGSNPPDAFKVK